MSILALICTVKQIIQDFKKKFLKQIKLEFGFDILCEYRNQANKKEEEFVMQEDKIKGSGNKLVIPIEKKNKESFDLEISFFENNIVHMFVKGNSSFKIDYIEPINLKPLHEKDILIENDEDILSCYFGKNTIKLNKKSLQIDFYSEKKLVFSQNSQGFLKQCGFPVCDFTFQSKFIYGLAGHADSLLLKDTTKGYPYRFFNRDRFSYKTYHRNSIYGTIPIVISHDSQENIGLYWRNASESFFDIKKNEKSEILCLSECGNLDCFVLIQKDLKSFYKELGKLVGRTPLPPVFSLGYHHCRWSFESQKDVEYVDAGFDKNKIPYDVIYLDIDYTDKMKYFTFDLKSYPDPSKLIDDLGKKHRKLVTIIDPHIKVDKEYSVFNTANKNNYFIQNKKGDIYKGVCWPGESCWLDFLNGEVRDFWAKQFSFENFKYTNENVHIWNDMNEPSVFQSKDTTMEKTNLQRFYNPEAKESQIVEHREVHNLYGLSMVQGTYKGLIERCKENPKRPFVLTRSFFVGSQKYAAMWTGDTDSTWEYLEITLPMLLSLSVTGFGFVGSDVGGFSGNPSEELLCRFYELGVISPFFRGHSSKKSKRREPWLYSEKALQRIKFNIELRYQLLGYLYTSFWEFSVNCFPLLRPLWIAFPGKEELYDEDQIAMVGEGILACPITKKNLSKLVLNKLSFCDWYDFYTLELCDFTKEVNVEDKLPLFIKAGNIIPLFNKNKEKYYKSSKDYYDFCEIRIVIVLDKDQKAVGKLYLDDGESFSYEKGNYALFEFNFEEGVFKSRLVEGYYESRLIVNEILIAKTDKFKKKLTETTEIKNNLMVMKNIDMNIFKIDKIQAF